jgi:5'-deoxynucleotidase YfbR-like HD superfamily hydrolase
MTSSYSAEKTPPLLSTSDRRAIFDKVLAALDKRFYKPEKLNDEWRGAVKRHRPSIEAADTAAEFEIYWRCCTRRI